jgi:hypothetical protein
MYYTPETLLNHVFEDLRKTKAPNTTRGMSGQFTPPRMTIEEVNNRGHSIPHKLRGSNKALSGCQLQEAEAPEASEEGLGISLEKFIAYSVVRTRAILQGCAMSPFRNKRK